MKVWKLLKRDMYLGIVKRSPILFLVPVVVFAMSHEFAGVIKDMNELQLVRTNGTVMDYFMFCMQGMNVFHFDPRQYFSIPIYWFAYQIVIAYFVAYYPWNDFKDYGRNIYIMSKNRCAWWISKCVWCGCSVAIYFGLTIFSVMVISILYGADFSFLVTEKLMAGVFGIKMEYVTSIDIVLITILLPFLITISLSLLQILMSFVISPVISFALICAIYVLSAYYTRWFLPGSFTMWLRSSYISVEGLHPLSGCLIALFIMMVSYYLGKDYFKSTDVL